MNNRLLMSVAAAALIAGSGFASAQNPGGAGTAPSGGSAGMSREAPAGGAARSGATSAPAGGASADRAAPAERNAPVNKDEATDTTNKSDQKPAMKSTQSDDKMQRDDKRATDSTRDSGKASKDMKADSKTGDMKSGADTKSTSTETKSTTTTGQAGAGAKLTTEQRTKVTTVIKQQNVQPVTNVNFSISVGTRVPREVHFHPLPAEIITIYPDWRGYEFFLVRNEIIVVNPRTLEIVAVLDA